MVLKLGLEIEKHPTPNKIRWIKQGRETLVTERSHFTFSIGKHYSDSILCDVVEMDACHLILGRPWQYDVDAQHKRQDNIYIVFREGQKIIFRPLKGDPASDPTLTKTQSVLLTKGDGFLKRKFSWGDIAEWSFNSRSSYFQEGETDVGQFHPGISPERTLFTWASHPREHFSPGHTLFSDTVHLGIIHLRLFIGGTVHLRLFIRVLFTRDCSSEHYSPEVVHPSTVHLSTVHLSTIHPRTVHPRIARRTFQLSTPFDPSITYTRTTIFQSTKSCENPKHLRLLIHLLTKGENFLKWASIKAADVCLLDGR
jgi:hypothetical protein